MKVALDRSGSTVVPLLNKNIVMTLVVIRILMFTWCSVWGPVGRRKIDSVSSRTGSRTNYRSNGVF